MKKILFLLLLSIAGYGQTSTGQEQEFDYGIKNNSLQTITTPTYIGTFGTDGTQGKIPSAYIAKTASVQDSLNKKLNLPTGFLQGLQLSINADPTKFNIAAGYYVVTDFTNLTQPVVKIINYAGATGLTPAYLGTANSTYVALDVNGTVISSASPFTDAQRRTLAIVGNVVHSNNTTINVTNEIKAPIVAVGNQLHDFMKAIGFLNESGNVYSANGANLQINKSVGAIFGMGINASDYLSPHKLTIPSQTALTFAYRFQNGTQLADTQNINPNIYDVGGTSTATPSNKWTIQRINLFQSGLSRIQPGQTVYNSFNDAVVALPTQPFVTEQNIADNAVFRCYLIVQQGTTNLASEVAGGSAQFVPVDKFGNIIGNGSVALTYSNIVAALGFTPENVANKSDSYTASSSTTYASTKALVNGLGKNQTFWIASSDATADEKLRSNYVCDGTADEVQINAAIQAVSSSRGGKINLTAGRFFLAAPVIIDRSLELTGSGRGIKLSSDLNTTAADTRGTTLLAVNNTDVIKIDTPNKLQVLQISDMLIVGYGRQNSPTGMGINIAGGSDVSVFRNLSISDCYAGIFYNHDVTAQMLDTPWIDQCSIQRNHVGMLIIGGHLMRITNNIFWENYGIGSYGGYAFNCGGLAIQGLGNHIISNNHFGESNFIEGANVSKNSSHISLVYSDPIISDNVFNDIQGNAIKLTEFSSYTKITNNYFKNFGKGTGLINAQRSGIYIEGSQSNWISDNYMISTTGTYGIYEDYLSFKNSFVNNNFNNLLNLTANQIFSEGTDAYESGTVVRPTLLPEKYVKIEGDVTINGNKFFKQSLEAGSIYGSIEIGKDSSGRTIRAVVGGSTNSLDIDATSVNISGNLNVGDAKEIRLSNGSDTYRTSVTSGSVAIRKDYNTPFLYANENELLLGTTSNGVDRLRVNGSISGTNYTGSATLTGTPTAPTATAGTNTTQIATTAFVQATRPYKVYTALLSQTGTSAPTATVLENTLGGTVVWTRNNIGQYVGTLTGAFTDQKTIIFVNRSNPAATAFDTNMAANVININTVGYTTFSNSAYVDGQTNSASIEIRVYN